MKKAYSEYLDWAFHQHIPRFHMARSGVSDCAPTDFNLTFSDLLLSGRNVDGYEELKSLIAAEYDTESKNVVSVHGTTTGNFVTLGALLNTGDEVIVERPTYDPLLSAARYFGATIKRIEREFKDGYGFDINQVEKLITEKTKLIILTNPHNPSGVLLEEKLIAEMAILAAKVGAFVLVDEVYRDIWFENAPRSHFLIADNIISTNSLTKSYGLGATRAGWILCNDSLALQFQKFYNLMCGTNAMPVDGISVAAFKNLKRLKVRASTIIEPNYKIVREFFDKNSEFLEVVLPRRAITVFPRLKSFDGDWLYDRLLKLDASVVPGRFFESPKSFRIGFAQGNEELKGGLEALSQALKG